MVRVRSSGRLGFVCDFDEDVCGGLQDPSCVRTVELFAADAAREEWDRIECFLEDLDEVIEAEGSERHLVCSDFEHMRIENHWTEDTPMEQHYTIWVAMEGGGASAWLESGYAGPTERLACLNQSEAAKLRGAINNAHIYGWRHFYNHGGWRIGSNAWRITLIRGGRKATTGGDDAYHHCLEGLCDALRSLGLPIAFWEGHGLKYCPSRTKGRRGAKGGNGGRHRG